jgi:hypothetical protein
MASATVFFFATERGGMEMNIYVFVCTKIGERKGFSGSP